MAESVSIDSSVLAPSAARAQNADSSYRAFRRVRFFGCLDGLRGLSILAVIWHHTVSQYLPANWPLVHEGNRGVYLFFAISAFLISTLLLRAKEGGSLRVPNFWARRALRIFPLYFVVLLVYVASVALFEHDATARQGFFGNLRYFATFTSNWFVAHDSSRVIFYFAWSLAAEEQFYLCWPWIERFLPRWGPVAVALALTALSQGLLIAYVGTAVMPLPIRIITGVPFAILFGVVVAHVLQSATVYRSLFRVAGRRGSAITAAAVTVIALAAEPQFGAWRELVVGAVMALLVLTCVIREDNDLAPFLRLRPIAWIGVVSYGIYLMHMLSVHVFHSVANAALHRSSVWLDFTGGALLSIAVASLSYITYERFFLKLKDRWFGNPTNVHHPAPPEMTTPVRSAILPFTSGVRVAGR